MRIEQRSGESIDLDRSDCHAGDAAVAVAANFALASPSDHVSIGSAEPAAVIQPLRSYHFILWRRVDYSLLSPPSLSPFSHLSLISARVTIYDVIYLTAISRFLDVIIGRPPRYDDGMINLLLDCDSRDFVQLRPVQANIECESKRIFTIRFISGINYNDKQKVGTDRLNDTREYSHDDVLLKLGL